MPDGFAVFSKVETTSVATGIDVTVVCTKPVTPGFTRLEDPDRLVIDLPDTLVGNHPQSVHLNSADVRAMRINQFQKNPPVTRIVLDLVGDRQYSYEPKGDSFVVHLRSVQASAAETPAQPAAMADGTVGLGLKQPPAKGALVVAANKIAPGSAITAGGDTAVLRLERGGEIWICPGTTASVTPSANGRSVMTGMSEGAVELHYPLTSSADTVLTPDFRILLPGPGEFHYAISADAKGNTCVRALQGNTASAVVSELMGDGTYQVKPGEQVVFHSGRLAQADAHVPLECGCPPPRQTQQMAAEPAPGRPVADPSLTAQIPSPDPSAPPKAQVVVDAPIVFRASEMPPEISHAAANIPAARTSETLPIAVVAPPRKIKKAKVKKDAKKEKTSPAKAPVVSQPTQPPPPKPAAPAPAPAPPTFMGKVKSFFRSIFK